MSNPYVVLKLFWLRHIVLYKSACLFPKSSPCFEIDGLQDEAEVIYTVAYPEVKMSWMDISSLARLLRRNFCRANRIFKQILGSSAILEAHGACINAWGYDTYGMRLARINNVTTLNTRFHPYQLL